jgi:hypothetical protein
MRQVDNLHQVVSFDPPPVAIPEAPPNRSMLAGAVTGQAMYSV